jgi:hypothetical protein
LCQAKPVRIHHHVKVCQVQSCSAVHYCHELDPHCQSTSIRIIKLLSFYLSRYSNDMQGLLLRDHHVSRLPTHGLDPQTSAYTQVRLDEANPIPSEQIRSPLPFTETTTQPRYISHTGTGTSRYTTTLLRTLTTLLDVPRDK